MSYGDLPVVKGSGKYLKIEPGQAVDINILTKSEDVVMQKVHGVGASTAECGGEVCADCDDGEESRTTYTVNIWNRKQKKVQIYRFGAMVAEQVRDIAKMLEQDNQTIHEVDLRIMKTGSGRQTKIKVIQRPFASEIPDTIELYELHDK